MANVKKGTDGALADAARALEAEVERFEGIVSEGQRLEVTTEKTLQRARALLESCADCEQRMASQLQAFVAAMQGVQERQRAGMDAVGALAARVQGRIEGRNTLLERFAALGERTVAMNEPVSRVLEPEASGAQPAVMAALQQIVARTEEIVAEADLVANDAREGQWADIAREADALKQQVQSARNKVLQVQRRVAGGAPS